MSKLHGLRRGVILIAGMLLASTLPASAQSARIGGLVRNAAGQPLRSVTITASSADASATTFTATTDDRGRFSIAGLRPGSWTFIAQAPGYGVEEIALDIRSIGPPNPPLTFTLQQQVAAAGGRLGSVPLRDLQAQLAEADAAFAAQRWDEALRGYRAVLERAPSLTAVHLQIAAAHRQRREFTDALSAYRAILTSDPANEKAHVGIAMTRLEQGDLQTAEADLLKATPANAPGPERLYALGEINRAQGERDEAIRWYTQAADADRSWAKPRLRLGELATEAGDQAAARRHMEAAVAVAPLSPEAALARTALERLGK